MPRKKQNQGKGQGKGKGQDKKKASLKAQKTATQKAAPKKAKRTAPKRKRAAKDKSLVYEHVFDNPRNVKKAIYYLFAVCGLSLLLDFFVNRYVDHPWEALFGFYAVYGFVACVFLVLAAKGMRKLIMLKDNYYDE